MPAWTHTAYTAPLNPPGATPVLTLPQVWAALNLKVRSAETFVPIAISHTDVLKEYTTPAPTSRPVVEREVVFVGDAGGKKVFEKCTFFEPLKVEFQRNDGSMVMNVVSQGSGGEGDLWMTYTFETLHEELDGGDEEKVREQRGKDLAMATKAVEGTVEVIRRLVREGKL